MVGKEVEKVGEERGESRRVLGECANPGYKPDMSPQGSQPSKRVNKKGQSK